jgi:hypothetical protein
MYFEGKKSPLILTRPFACEEQVTGSIQEPFRGGQE